MSEGEEEIMFRVSHQMSCVASGIAAFNNFVFLF